MKKPTTAPVIAATMATPKNASSHPTTKPPGEVTKLESPEPMTVVIAQ